ncbi:hypothetical protein ABS858_00345 [Vibrio neptunius]|uniref:hypothetical protein n=1 Tax=Vibrio neptunius TaxID=170651 RepID=UPI0033158CF6
MRIWKSVNAAASAASISKAAVIPVNVPEQRSNANTQNYLQAYKPLEELNLVVEPEEVLTEDTSSTLEMPQGPESPAPNSKGSGWLCAGIGATI